MTTAIGIAALVLLLSWVFGGFMLRLGGVLPVFAGVAGMALSANSDSILISVIGALLWLFGHGHYALRHAAWKSRLAESLWYSALLLLRRVGRVVAASVDRHKGERDSALDDGSGGG